MIAQVYATRELTLFNWHFLPVDPPVPVPIVQIPARAGAGVKLQVAIESVLAAKLASNKRERYVQSLRQYLNQFARWIGDVPLASITVDDLENWFTTRKEASSTRASNMGRLAALFSYAVRREWIKSNPVDNLERVTVETKVPRILTPAEARKLLEYVRDNRPNQLAYLTLALLCGIRPEEVQRIGWSSVNEDCSVVTIDAAASKVRRRRIIKLEPSAQAWLRLAKEKNATLPLSRTTRRRYLDQWCRVLGFSRWPQDLLRHSCASYWLALCEDPAKVSWALGNSANILKRHYMELVQPEDVGRFWSIMP